ncbi:MAG: hypothetical protein JO257_30195, partial [Deltaproteobacteria bacterium]|nr:hypothetical protein [Deltaproteobacteria bacterium]
MRRLAPLFLLTASACIGTSHECENIIQEVRVHSTDASIPEYVDTYPSSFGLPATALGGTQRFRADYLSCDATTPMMLSSVRADDPQRATLTLTSSSTFDFTPLSPGAATITVSGNLGSTSEALHAAAIDHVALVGQELGEPGAFYVGAPLAMIQLLDSSGAPLVDRNVSIVSGAFQLGDAWNHLALGSMPAGQYSLAVNAGGQAWPLDVTLVDHLTGVIPEKENVTGVTNEPTDVCFFAYLGPVLVAGVPWQFSF